MIGSNSYVRGKIKEEKKYYIFERFCSKALINALYGFLPEGSLLTQLDKLSTSRLSSSLPSLLREGFHNACLDHKEG